MMETTTLILWLWIGPIVPLEIEAAACPIQIEQAIAASRTGIPQVSLPGLTASVVRMQCGGRDVVLALPESIGPCEEPTS